MLKVSTVIIDKRPAEMIIIVVECLKQVTRDVKRVALVVIEIADC
ncbi:MAG TPA: hypothetical protein VKA09_11510 [Nitrososphaeraceae archaeon]|nr:hypothetical protein [Nitrososphaeraceae archaeon]